MTILQLLSDFGVFFGWFFSSLKTIFLCLLAPVSYIFTYLKIIIAAVFSSAPTPEVSYQFGQNVLAVFDKIPYWTTLSAIIGALIVLVLGVSTLKLILKT